MSDGGTVNILYRQLEFLFCSLIFSLIFVCPKYFFFDILDIENIVHTFESLKK